jgi:hypothetical protein
MCTLCYYVYPVVVSIIVLSKNIVPFQFDKIEYIENTSEKD